MKHLNEYEEMGKNKRPFMDHLNYISKVVYDDTDKVEDAVAIMQSDYDGTDSILQGISTLLDNGVDPNEIKDGIKALTKIASLNV